MKSFVRLNPAALMLYYTAVTVVSMFCVNPFMLVISLVAAVLLQFAVCGRECVRSLFACAGVFAVVLLANPLFSHNGATVLFVMNNNPVTAQAFFYGFYAAITICSVMCWMNTFSKIMTSDKLTYVFGRLSPKLALVFSMSLRFIPLFIKQIKLTSDAQRVAGLYKDESVFERIKSSMCIFSIIVTWALENGITTAESMAARGYGSGRRSSFAMYGFEKNDFIFIVILILLFSVTAAGMALGDAGFTFYPYVTPPETTPPVAAAYIAFGLLAMMPATIETGEKLRWKFLLLKT